MKYLDAFFLLYCVCYVAVGQVARIEENDMEKNSYSYCIGPKLI